VAAPGAGLAAAIVHQGNDLAAVAAPGAGLAAAAGHQCNGLAAMAAPGAGLAAVVIHRGGRSRGRSRSSGCSTSPLLGY